MSLAVYSSGLSMIPNKSELIVLSIEYADDTSGFMIRTKKFLMKNKLGNECVYLSAGLSMNSNKIELIVF